MSMGVPALKPAIFAWQTTTMNPPDSSDDAPYWRRIQRLTGVLLLVWAVVAFGLVYFARNLSFTFFGWPFGFWVAAQGAILVFIAIVAYYAHATRKLDEMYGEG